MSGASAERLSEPRPRSETQPETPLEELVIQLLGREKGHPVSFKELRRDIARRIDNQPEGAVRSTLARLVARDDVLDLGDGEYFLASNLELVERRICEVMAAYHATFPYDAGMSTGEIKKRYSKGKVLNARRNIDPRLFDRAMSACKERGVVVASGEGVRLADFAPTTDQLEEFRRLEQAILAYIGERRYNVFDLQEMTDHLAVDPRKTRTAYARLLKDQQVIRYSDGRCLEASVLDQIQATLTAELNRATRLTTAEIKTLLDIPRNALIELLEYLDSIGFTRREGTYRVLRSAE
jgi:selenocysteine-specific elongation factor